MEGLDGPVRQEGLASKASGVQIVRLVDGQWDGAFFRLEVRIEPEAFNYGWAYLAPYSALVHPNLALRCLVGKGDPKDRGSAHQVNKGAHAPLDVHADIGTLDVKRSIVNENIRACLKGLDGGDR
jgi:hypothetical protein